MTQACRQRASLIRILSTKGFSNWALGTATAFWRSKRFFTFGTSYTGFGGFMILSCHIEAGYPTPAHSKNCQSTDQNKIGQRDWLAHRSIVERTPCPLPLPHGYTRSRSRPGECKHLYLAPFRDKERHWFLNTQHHWLLYGG